MKHEVKLSSFSIITTCLYFLVLVALSVYGKASDCFLVELKNKRIYLLGCEDSSQIVDFICSAHDIEASSAN